MKTNTFSELVAALDKKFKHTYLPFGVLEEPTATPTAAWSIDYFMKQKEGGAI